MASQAIAVVPSKQKQVLLLDDTGGQRVFSKPQQAIKWLAENLNGAVILGTMGGPGQELFGRMADSGISVFRTPFSRLQEFGFEPKASSEDRAAMLQAAWQAKPEGFYPLREIDQTVMLIRELTRQRLNVQESRKMATLQLHSALRSMEFVLPDEAATAVELLRKGLKKQFSEPETLRQIEAEFQRLAEEVALSSGQQARIFAIRQFFSNPRFILGAKEDEQELEKQISKLLASVGIWQWLRRKGTTLPAIKGLGPAIGGAIVSEIGDIRRFPSSEDLRAYARFHINREGKFPHRKKGELSPFNRYLSRAVWLWTSDQVARYDHVWRELYQWKKAREMKAHPEPVARQAVDKTGRQYTIYDFSLKHLDSRAKRWTGSQLLNYLWSFWQEVAANRDPETWYVGSSWPAYFAQAEAELNDRLMAYLEEQIPLRRRKEPKEEEPDEEEEGI
ncbi:MAG: transposase [bacterium]|nr:transposase [bacterium]